VTDKNNGYPIFAQLYNQPEQFFDFLRDQYGSGLIQDQDTRPTIQSFNNFYFLLLTNG